MLCGLPLPSLNRKVSKRVRPVISAPLPQGSPTMNVNGRANDANGNESGVYYFVTNPGTGVQQLVKRPPAPPTETSPLDDDFDAYTETNLGPAQPQYPRRSEDLSRSRSLGVSVSASPRGASLLRNTYDTSLGSSRRPVPLLSNNNNSNSNSNSRASYLTTNRTPQRRVKPPAVPHVLSPQPNQDHRQLTSSSLDPATTQGANKGKSREIQKEAYGEHTEYMQEMEKMFSKHGDFDISINRMNDTSGARESVTLGRVRSVKSSSSHRHEVRSPNLTGKADTSANLGRNLSMTSAQSRAPKPRQVYEEVDRRVVENTPEKTVTISTWREKVAQEANDTERMSVFWYTQEDYQEENTKSEADRDLGQRGTSSSGRSGRDGALLPEKPPPKLHHGILRAEGQKKPVEDQPISRKETMNSPKPMWEHESLARSPQRRQLSPKPSKKPTSKSPAERRSDFPPNSSSSSADKSGSSSNSEELPPTPPPKPPRLSIKYNNAPKPRNLMQSTPIDNRVTMPSFYPTKDGSVISTIRSTSSATSLTFEHVLDSCKPPLAHLAPVLAKLGITSITHLRALADLNPETRDRELKDDALRLGVTAMEWAILVDRLRML